MSEAINFISNTKDYKFVKKLKIEKETEKIEILDFLIFIEISTNLEIQKYLQKIINLNGFEKEITLHFNNNLQNLNNFLNSNNFSKLIEKYMLKNTSDKEVTDLLKAYFLNKYFMEKKVFENNAFGYYNVLFPSRKKQLKNIFKK